MLNDLMTQSIPKSMRPLFTTLEANADMVIIGPPDDIVESNGSHEMRHESPEHTDINNDYDLMFSNKVDPCVGSYAEMGRFTYDKDYLMFLE